MARPRIYITQPVALSAIERLRTVADVDLNPDTAHIVTKPELLAAVHSHDLLFCLLHDKLDGEVIAANPALKAIASMKITPSDIDVEEATRRRIPVTVIPPIVTEATADLHMALMLAGLPAPPSHGQPFQPRPPADVPATRQAACRPSAPRSAPARVP